MSADDIKKELLQLIENLSENELKELLAMMKERQSATPTNELLAKFKKITDRDDWVFQELAK